MHRWSSWRLGAPLFALLATLIVVPLGSAFTDPYDILHHVGTTSFLPEYYQPDTDEICIRNGIRNVACSADNFRLVKLDSVMRANLHQLIAQKQNELSMMQLAVYVMLVDLERNMHHGWQVGQSTAQQARATINDQVQMHLGLAVSQSDMDPSIDGPGAAKRLGAPPVTAQEESCYKRWLQRNKFATADVDTALNELYVRHVTITRDKKRWDIQSTTGCTENTLLKRDTGDRVDAVVDDDMNVYHPVLGTHNQDPWAKWREFDARHEFLPSGEFGHRKRSIQRRENCVGGHRHRKRGGRAEQQGADASVPLASGVDYAINMPSAPTPGGVGAGVVGDAGLGGSRISSQPHGFAAQVTGGGSTAAVVPKDVNELVQLLSDAQPRVIHLDKVYDLRTTEGICTNCRGCIPDSYVKCPDKGQLAIDNGQGWCKDKRATAVTYDKAGLTPITVSSNKSVIGITSNAAIRGKGLRIAHHQNVFLHNFRIDEINPQYIWGGDGITLYDTDLIWIDRITFAHIGRQFIVTGYESAGRVTISNCLFDGATKWSATCDGSHYWTVLGYGSGDKVTFSSNVMSNCSGRSPRIASPDANGQQPAVWHIVNTIFDHNTGHSLDMGPGVSALIEGNVFNDVAQTSLHEATPGKAFAPSDQPVCNQCKGPLGRNCQPNAYKNANPVPSTSNPADVLKDVAKEKVSGAMSPRQVIESVSKSAGAAGEAAVIGASSPDASPGASGDAKLSYAAALSAPQQPPSAGQGKAAAVSPDIKKQQEEEQNKKQQEQEQNKKHDQQKQREKKQQEDEKKQQQQKPPSPPAPPSPPSPK